MRIVPAFLYLALMVWVALPTEDRKAGKMYLIQRRIRLYRKVAEAYGDEVIRLENLYTEVAKS